MPSETDLLNDALGQIGEDLITAIDDGSRNANACQDFYPELRDSALRSHTWNFAMTRVELALDATAPLYGYAYSYSLPTDCLKIVEYNGSTTGFGRRYKKEGAHILTNDTQVFIQYITRITNPDLWDAMFYQYLATHLASKLCSAIPKDTKKADALLKTAMEILLPTAMSVDSQEEPVQPIRSRALIWGRNPIGRLSR